MATGVGPFEVDFQRYTVRWPVPAYPMSRGPPVVRVDQIHRLGSEFVQPLGTRERQISFQCGEFLGDVRHYHGITKVFMTLSNLSENELPPTRWTSVYAVCTQNTCVTIIKVQWPDQTALFHFGTSRVERMVYAGAPMATPVRTPGLLFRCFTVFHLYTVHHVHVLMFVRGWGEITVKITSHEVGSSFRRSETYVV